MIDNDCGNCRFARIHSIHQAQELRCHRNSPVVAGTSEHGYSMWPLISAGDWCGEYQLAVENIYPERKEAKE